jgi:hypothetical protein
MAEAAGEIVAEFGPVAGALIVSMPLLLTKNMK